MTAEQERAKVVALIEDMALSLDEGRSNWPAWKHFLWATFNSRQHYKNYGAFFALVEAARAIERGDHHNGETQ